MNLRKDHYRFAFCFLVPHSVSAQLAFSHSIGSRLKCLSLGLVTGLSSARSAFPVLAVYAPLFRGTCSVLEATHGDGFEAASANTHELFTAWELAGLRGSKSRLLSATAPY